MFKFSNDPFHPFPTRDDYVKMFTKPENRLLNLPTIPEFFKDREIFITGATGFVGKALVEKLLRSCPDLKTIYILMREKKGQSIEERLKKMINTQVFDILRIKNPKFSANLTPITGDVSLINVGISESDKNLMKNVSIIFHCAATVKFDEPLTDAILMNTRGTHEVMKLAETLKSLKALIHVSTAYSNAHLRVVEEKIYPPIADWKEMIKICEKVDENKIELLTRHSINFMVNTYVFSKNLAEHVTESYSKKIPLVLYRPSIIMPAYYEPFGGYFESFNGPMGVATAVFAGICRSFYADPNNLLDIIPVDVVVKGMIIAAWKRAHENENIFPVYNCTASKKVTLKTSHIFNLAITGVGEQFPIGQTLFMAPNVTITKNKIWHGIHVIFYQITPALIVDLIMRVKGKKQLMMKIQRKMFKASSVSYFGIHDWTFEHDKFFNLSSYLRHEDIKNFNFEHYFTLDCMLYVKKCIYGMREFLFNLKEEDLEKDQNVVKKMRWIMKCLKIFVCSLFLILFYQSR